MFNSTKARILSFVENRGYRISRSPLLHFLRDLQIDSILDVGANEGQFAQDMRKRGYKGAIESFEPIPQALDMLKLAAARDANWRVHPYALGSENSSKQINISHNLPSSSFLPLCTDLDTGGVELQSVGSIEVDIKRLDDIYCQLGQDDRNVFLKIDTQGYEHEVILGATESLRSVQIVQMELSLTTNYTGETLVEDMIKLMRGFGFAPWWVVDGFRHPQSIRLYQMDVIFRRN